MSVRKCHNNSGNLLTSRRNDGGKHQPQNRREGVEIEQVFILEINQWSPEMVTILDLNKRIDQKMMKNMLL